MKYVFISGIPASGKSRLAKKVAKKTNSIHIDMDTLRSGMRKDPRTRRWVDFFLNQNEKAYWKNISPREHFAP